MGYNGMGKRGMRACICGYVVLDGCEWYEGVYMQLWGVQGIAGYEGVHMQLWGIGESRQVRGSGPLVMGYRRGE